MILFEGMLFATASSMGVPQNKNIFALIFRSLKNMPKKELSARRGWLAFSFSNDEKKTRGKLQATSTKHSTSTQTHFRGPNRERGPPIAVFTFFILFSLRDGRPSLVGDLLLQCVHIPD